jgi:DNA polymerase-3 subunit alpha
MGYKGVAITDHESVSAHIKAIKTVRAFKEKSKIPQDFKLILGNECYLVDDLETVKDNYKSGETKFPHFLLLSTTKKGHEILRLLSSRAWGRSFYTGTMERVPTLKADLEELVKPNKGLIIGSSACLGSESSIHLLAIKEAEKKVLMTKHSITERNYMNLLHGVLIYSVKIISSWKYNQLTHMSKFM